MPGDVAAAVSVGVMPFSLCRQFVEIREYPLLECVYKDGTKQISVIGGATTSRKRFQQTKRLTATLLSALRAWWDTAGGIHKAFYFYLPWETSPLFHYDATGVATTGRYLVRFSAPAWASSMDVGRGNVSLELIEVS